MFRSVIALSLLVFSLSMVVGVAILPRPQAEPVPENRTAAETIAATVEQQR